MIPARSSHESNPASPFKSSRPGYGAVIGHAQATQLDLPLRIHPLLNSQSRGESSSSGAYLSWNVIEHPTFASLWRDKDTELDWSKERHQPATTPIVEELQLGHVESGWSIRVRNRKGVTCEDVLYAIYDFFASPLYVDEMAEMYPRAVRIFEKRRMGFFDLEEGYRKSDALLGATYFDG
ncbi:hypothetical protein Q8F55_007514 [Vanrija albida]|uniref:DUF6699 domain-containing protein n=1 Tax=Vanrija albida TaxID=181172 RepID=A0ABR3PTS0_9TREE